MAPRAAGSQYGAPRPARAGTKTPPSPAPTCAASSLASLGDETTPSPSRSQPTAAPPTKALPSRA